MRVSSYNQIEWKRTAENGKKKGSPIYAIRKYWESLRTKDGALNKGGKVDNGKVNLNANIMADLSNIHYRLKIKYFGVEYNLSEFRFRYSMKDGEKCYKLDLKYSNENGTQLENVIEKPIKEWQNSKTDRNGERTGRITTNQLEWYEAIDVYTNMKFLNSLK